MKRKPNLKQQIIANHYELKRMATQEATTDQDSGNAEGVVIGSIVSDDKKNALLVRINPFRGQTYVDIRSFYAGNDGKFYPTRKGISINSKHLSQIITILEQTEAKLGAPNVNTQQEQS